jgi:formylglycine-generating enzyme required for sulfatase activity
MVKVPGGKFMMGCVEGRDDVVEGECGDEEKPAREVTIARPFTMGQYEVTFLQYDYYLWNQNRKGDARAAYPSDQGWGRFNRPVINVSWDDAKAYVRWLSEETGKAYRLPTEAEWEYAARAGTDKAYWWGPEFAETNANCSGDRTAPVDSFPASPWGLYDTAGNVYEWVEDAWHDSYEGAPTDGSTWEDEKSVSRVLRGGSWLNVPRGCRAAFRSVSSPGRRYDFFGFRVCCGAPIE